MASVQPTAAGGWRVSVCKMGVRETRTFPVGTPKGEAKNWGKLREAAIISEEKTARSKTGHKVRQLLEEFRDNVLPGREGYAWELGRINWMLANLPFLSMPLRGLEAEDVEGWIADRQREVSGASINRDIQLLGPVFKHGMKKKWIEANPLKGVTKPKNPAPRDVRITDADAEAVVQALGYVRGTQPLTKRERLAVAFLLALETGMRRGELLRTRWVNVHAVYIHLPADINKNRHKRDVPLSSAARELVGLLSRDADTLFGDLADDTADALFRDARKVAKLPELHFHDTRHEAVTRLARKLPLLDLARMIGHRDLNSLKVYYNATPEEISPLLG